MEPTKTCNHTYTTLGNRVYRCVAAHHPDHPDHHYFVRDLREQSRKRRNGLIVVPGERR